MKREDIKKRKTQSSQRNRNPWRISKKFDQITAMKQEDRFATTKTGNTILSVKKELMEDNYNLENKNALEIAKMLYNSQEVSRSDKQHLRFIKSLLEDEANQDSKVKKVKGKVETISLSD